MGVLIRLAACSGFICLPLRLTSKSVGGILFVVNYCFNLHERECLWENLERKHLHGLNRLERQIFPYEAYTTI
ncbi:hypothetical protein GGR57DRAFT_412105 [Xylariaceae sp. FL1272]|nr:hypothetical protein GGR57DRAFT_412105 [Xylariaceae sp. FL1272]